MQFNPIRKIALANLNSGRDRSSRLHSATCACAAVEHGQNQFHSSLSFIADGALFRNMANEDTAGSFCAYTWYIQYQGVARSCLFLPFRNKTSWPIKISGNSGIEY